MIKISRRGRTDNRARLGRVRYFKYTLKDKEFYIKEKAYVTYCDGWIDEELITKQTYNNALKRGKHKCLELSVEKNISEISLTSLSLIYKEIYNTKAPSINKSIYKAKESIKLIKNHIDVSPSTEYRVFNKVFNCHLNLEKEKVAI